MMDSAVNYGRGECGLGRLSDLHNPYKSAILVMDSARQFRLFVEGRRPKERPRIDFAYTGRIEPLLAVW